MRIFTMLPMKLQGGAIDSTAGRSEAHGGRAPFSWLADRLISSGNTFLRNSENVIGRSGCASDRLGQSATHAFEWFPAAWNLGSEVGKTWRCGARLYFTPPLSESSP